MPPRDQSSESEEYLTTEDTQTREKCTNLEAPGNQLELPSRTTLSEKSLGLSQAATHMHDPLMVRLPTDLVAYIFRCTLPVHDEGHAHPDDAPPMQLTIGAVCRAWRRVAWGAPELWSTLVCNVMPVHVARFAKDLVREWLARSGSLPLSLHVYTDGLDYSPPWNAEINNDAQALLDVLNACSARWQELCLSLPPNFVLHLTGSAISSSTSVLDRFRLRFVPESARPAQLAFCTQHFPTRVDIGRMALRDIGIGWTRLTHFSTDAFGVADCLELLGCAPLLEVLEIGSVLPAVNQAVSSLASHDHNSKSGSIVHPRLRTLLLTIHPARSDSARGPVDFLLDAITLPSLTALSLHISSQWMPTSRLVALLVWSHCCLRRLALRVPTLFAYEDLAEILDAIPDLQELELKLAREAGRASQGGTENVGLVTAFLARLALGDQPQFLPRLQSLRLDALQPCSVAFPWSFVPDIFSGGRPLRRLVLYVDTGDRRDDELTIVIGADIMGRLTALRDEGVEVDISWGSAKRRRDFA